MKIETIDLKKEGLDRLYQLSRESSKTKSKEILIYELSDLSQFFDHKDAEALRANFIQNNIRVKQISNTSKIPVFTSNPEFASKVMSFRYIPREIFTIRNEILIFDDTVAIYNKNELSIIEDEDFALNQKQLFLNIWGEGLRPSLKFEYRPNHSFYNSIDYFHGDMQIIVWPDADAKVAYADLDNAGLESYIKSIISSDDLYKDSSYIICFIWSLDGQKMVDVWKFRHNTVDDRSGPLSEVRVYREGEVCNDLGLASGNTLLVLGYEEKYRRQSRNLKSYLKGPVPNLPLEIMNGQDFF